MYDELIKRLRNRRICIQQSGSLDDFPLLGEAADAIEDAVNFIRKYEDAEKQGRMLRIPYKVGDLFWAVAYSDPRVICVRLYQITYHYKDGWGLWIENIDNENDWWKVPLEAFETWSCFDSYEEAEAALKGE